MKQLLIAIAIIVSTATAKAQQPITIDSKNELSLLIGLIQPALLKGGNFEADFYTKRMVFEYSHGFSLDMSEEFGTIPKEPKQQKIAYHIPYSTGFGVGYRLNKYFDLRLEPKLHRFEAYYEGTDRFITANQVVQYNTVTLGIGAYFRWKPFEQQTNFLKGFTTATSVRYWQNVYSTLDNDEHAYFNSATKQNEILKASNIGIAGSPIVINLSIGYSIKF